MGVTSTPRRRKMRRQHEDATMTTIRTMIHDRRIDFPAPSELLDGTEVLIEVSPLSGKVGLDESEWSDDAAALADWGAWLGTIEPVEFAQESAFDDEFRRFNIEAVRGKPMRRFLLDTGPPSSSSTMAGCPTASRPRTSPWP
jgi:hypothetical protein